ncbi:MAG: glycosyltransferase [Planctomycetes bacterium]|nr:glycosyltransferase [Planctomycetota bacterium]
MRPVATSKVGGLLTSARAGVLAGSLCGLVFGLVDGGFAISSTLAKTGDGVSSRAPLGVLSGLGCVAGSVLQYTVLFALALLVLGLVLHPLLRARDLGRRYVVLLALGLGAGVAAELYWRTREHLFYGHSAVSPERLAVLGGALALGLAAGFVAARALARLSRGVQVGFTVACAAAWLGGGVYLAAEESRGSTRGAINERNRDLPNVVLVVVDALRQDVLGCYGHPRVKTPNLDRLAERGVLFENAFVQAPFTWTSFGSLLTGKYPRRHGLIKMKPGYKLRPQATLPWHLKHATRADGRELRPDDYVTASFHTGTLQEGSGLLRGFDYVFEETAGHELQDLSSPWSQFRSELLLWIFKNRIEEALRLGARRARSGELVGERARPALHDDGAPLLDAHAVRSARALQGALPRPRVHGAGEGVLRGAPSGDRVATVRADAGGRRSGAQPLLRRRHAGRRARRRPRARARARGRAREHARDRHGGPRRVARRGRPVGAQPHGAARALRAAPDVLAHQAARREARRSTRRPDRRLPDPLRPRRARAAEGGGRVRARRRRESAAARAWRKGRAAHVQLRRERRAARGAGPRAQARRAAQRRAAEDARRRAPRVRAIAGTEGDGAGLRRVRPEGPLRRGESGRRAPRGGAGAPCGAACVERRHADPRGARPGLGARRGDARDPEAHGLRRRRRRRRRMTRAVDLVLVANARIPSQRAQTLQIVQMAAAFERAGAHVALFHAKRRPTVELPPGQDAWRWYGVQLAEKPLLEPIRCLDWIDRVPRVLQYVPARLQEQSFGKNAARAVLEHHAGARVLTRELETAHHLAKKKRPNVFLELHRVPGGRLRRRALKASARACAGIVAISGGVKTDLVALGIDERRIVVEHDGFEPERFAKLPKRAKARAELGLPTSVPLVVYTGGLLEWKGVDLLVDAARALPDAYFVIAGGMDADVKRLRQKAGGLANVRIDGFQPPERVPLYLAAGDVGVAPNRSKPPISARYTSPLKVFESMAAGLPLVASDLPSLRELLTHEKDAWLVAPDDAGALAEGLKKLLGDAALRARLAQAFHARASEHAWIARARRLLAWMDEER